LGARPGSLTLVSARGHRQTTTLLYSEDLRSYVIELANFKAPKKTVATDDRATRGTTRFTVNSSGGRPTDLTSKPTDSACGSTITSKSLRSRGAKNLRQGSQQASSTEVADSLLAAERKERRLTKMADVVDEETASLDDEVEYYRCTVLTDEGRESSSTPTVTRGKVTDGKSAGRERCRTRLVHSSSMEVPKGRAARSKLTHAADYGQCDRRRRLPAEAALSHRERTEEEDISKRSVDSDILEGTQRMKMRHEAKVKAIQLELDDWALYYIPQGKVGRNQNWRRLCKIGRVVQRFNVVLYSIKLGPRAAPIIAHVDRLWRYEGSPPEQWRLSVGQPNRQPSAVERNCQQQSNVITQPKSSIRRQGVAIERLAAADDTEEGLKRGTPLATTASSPANKRVMSTTQSFPFTLAQASLLEAIVYLMTETQRRTVTMAVAQQQRILHHLTRAEEEDIATARTIADVFRRQVDAMLTRPVLQGPTELPASALQTDYQDVVSID
jgi:hypothetical protein